MEATVRMAVSRYGSLSAHSASGLPSKMLLLATGKKGWNLSW